MKNVKFRFENLNLIKNAIVKKKDITYNVVINYKGVRFNT